MLTEIETQILQRLWDKGLPADTSGTTNPAVYCRVESGTFAKTAQGKLKLDALIYLSFVFNSTDTEDTRRNTVFPLLTGALNILALQDLGLTIDPLLPVSFQNITSADDVTAGLLVYQLQFKTYFYIEKMDDEAVTDLLKVALDYYLQEPSDDGVKDAADEITLGI